MTGSEALRLSWVTPPACVAASGGTAGKLESLSWEGLGLVATLLYTRGWSCPLAGNFPSAQAEDL